MAMNKQEIFDKVAEHLLTQRERAYGTLEDVCYYRIGKNGKTLKCAVGCLIPDEYYTPSMEKAGVADDRVLDILIKADILEDVPENVNFDLLSAGHLLSVLQTVHDSTPLPWEAELVKVANKFRLKLPELVIEGEPVIWQ